MQETVETRTSNDLYKGELDIPEARQAAINLLSVVQQSIPIEVFNPLKYWSIFESRVRAAAVQNISLKAAFEQMKRKLQIVSLKGELVEILRILERPDADDVLDQIRQYPALLVTHVRVIQQERKEDYKEKQEALSDGLYES